MDYVEYTDYCPIVRHLFADRNHTATQIKDRNPSYAYSRRKWRICRNWNLPRRLFLHCILLRMCRLS